MWNPSNSLKFAITGITFEKVASPARTSGWQPQPKSIAYSTSGYLPNSMKTAVIGKDLLRWHRRFRVERDGKTVYKSRIRKMKTSIGTFGELDFSEVTDEGVYTVSVGKVTTHEFAISQNLWKPAEEKLVNYIHCQRCGYEIPGIHAECHHDLFAEHSGQTISYGGGWHDAGDLS